MSKGYYRVKLAVSAKDDLRRIAKKYGKKTYEIIRDLIRDLAIDPVQKGEPLRGKLSGLLSRHYSRFRIIYRVNGREFTVIVIAAGWHESDSRADIYRVIERLVERGDITIRKRESSSDRDES